MLAVEDDASRYVFALIFDLSFYASYRFSQVRRLFRQTGMRGTFTDEEIDDIVELAYEVQDGRSYPTVGYLRRRRFLVGGDGFEPR